MEQDNVITGVWSPKDDEAGTVIKWYIENHSNMKVVKSDVSKATPDIHNKTDGRFLVLLSKNLLDEHVMLVYITEVLFNLYKNGYLTATVVNIDPGMADTKVPVNLRSLPYFTCFPPHTEQDLHPICLQLTGALRPVIPIGNVGIGLAWSYFYGYLNLILPGITERIRNSKFYNENVGRVFSKFLILLPKSCNTPNSLKDVDPRFASVGPLDDGFKRSRAGQPERLYKNFVNKVHGTDGKDYYFCGEFATPLLAMLKMLQDDMCGMDEQELRKQMAFFQHTLMSLLNHENNPSCLGMTHILYYDDEKPFPLADEICKIISEVSTPPSPDSNPPSRSSSMSSYVAIQKIKFVAHKEDSSMETSIHSFCQELTGFMVGLESFETVEAMLKEDEKSQHNNGAVSMNVDDQDGSSSGPSSSLSGVKDPPTKFFIILSRNSIKDVETNLPQLLAKKELFEACTFVIELPPEDPTPAWLEQYGADYIDSRKDMDIWKRIMGSLFGTSTIEGEDDQRWQNLAVGLQYQVDRLPVGNVAEGLAWSYYHNYLTLIGPTLRDRIAGYDDGRVEPTALILVPKSCYSFPTLTDADDAIQLAGKLETLTIQIAGNNRNYDTNIHSITDDAGKKYYACVEYCTPVLVMYEMEAEGKAGLSKLQREAQLLFFYDTLKRILQHASAKKYSEPFHLVYYDDIPEKPLSEILIEEIENLKKQ